MEFPLVAWDRLRYFVVVLPKPSIWLFSLLTELILEAHYNKYHAYSSNRNILTHAASWLYSRYFVHIILPKCNMVLSVKSSNRRKVCLII